MKSNYSKLFKKERELQLEEVAITETPTEPHAEPQTTRHLPVEPEIQRVNQTIASPSAMYKTYEVTVKHLNVRSEPSKNGFKIVVILYDDK